MAAMNSGRPLHPSEHRPTSYPPNYPPPTSGSYHQPPAPPPPHHILPPIQGPPRYHDTPHFEHREPPDARSGYTTPVNGQHRPSYSNDPAYSRVSSTPLSSGPPGDQHRPPAKVEEQEYRQDMDQMQHHVYRPADQHYGPPPIMMHAPHDNMATPVLDHPSHYPPQLPPPGAPYGQPGPQHYASGPTAMHFPGGGIPKRKQMRAAQACDACRARKQKCDENKPCGFCNEQNQECTYREVPPAKQDRAMQTLLDAFKMTEEKFEERFENLEAKMLSIAQSLGAPERRDISSTRPPKAESEPEQTPNPAPTKVSNSDAPPKQQFDVAMLTNVEDVALLAELDDHSTAPHKLLSLWPSMAAFHRETAVYGSSNEYVIEGEESRGLLRLHGRGEGPDREERSQADPASPAHSNESEDSSPAGDDHMWGTGYSPAPMHHHEIKRSEPQGPGGYNMDGSLKLDEKTVNQLFDSYMRHMHILHPFLDRGRMRRLMDKFINRHKTQVAASRSPFAVSNGFDKPLKRKRSNGSMPGSGPSTGSDSYPSSGRNMPERSISSALVLLILALGKICEYRDPLPGAVGSTIDLDINALRRKHVASPMTVKPSPAMSSTSTATATTGSSTENGRPGVKSRRSSVEAASVPEKIDLTQKNTDRIPGLAYFAQAVSILGDFVAGNDLSHAQAFLLAALYYGQLARPLCSWRENLFLSNEKLSKRALNPRENLILLAFWTALQLEGDIQAEIDLPSSGIGKLESTVRLPLDIPEDMSYDFVETPSQPDPDNVLMYYISQLFLRKQLNKIHDIIYGSRGTRYIKGTILVEQEKAINQWREILTPQLQWDEDEPPARYINAARLRAKYYGLRYITHRPYLEYALHVLGTQRNGEPWPRISQDVPSRLRESVERWHETIKRNFSNEVIMERAQICIEAAFKSTVALDGVPKRLIVTNIFGTSHAQFGNMLVLAATYQSSLHHMVPREKLERLLHRTISFLRELVPISATALRDASVLDTVRNICFPVTHTFGEIEPKSANHSFSFPSEGEGRP
ncbi:hypothetical protein LTR66_009681 [Elasticomyces elasticus]|nr:hypothetical protein LTR66_009681 [Elasticomyces elasticus]